MVDRFVNGELKQNKQENSVNQLFHLFFYSKISLWTISYAATMFATKMLAAKMSTTRCYGETTGHRILWCVNYISILKREMQLHLKYFV